jgi:hypothetical protein
MEAWVTNNATTEEIKKAAKAAFNSCTQDGS